MKKQAQKLDGGLRDRPESAAHPDSGAGTPQISPAVLAAGVRVIVEEWGICGDDIAPGLARDVFNAMWAIRHDQEKNS